MSFTALIVSLSLLAPLSSAVSTGAVSVGEVSVRAEASVEQLDAVTSALGSSDARGAAAHFDQTVEVVLPGVEDILAKDAAEQVLSEFFAANPVAAFTKVHGGTSAGAEGTYVIGTLSCANGTSYRVYVYGAGEGASVQELRIELE